MKLKKITVLFSIFSILLSHSFCSRIQTGTAQLKFVVLDEERQQPIPAKLVFVKGKDDKFDLNIPETYGLAPENNGFFTAFGKGQVEVPAGKYTIYASRGMEYSIDKKSVNLKKDAVVEQQWTIKREIDPAGYIGADLHMHTTNSDGHCSEEERVTSLIGAGVEFAVASDHNYVTDFQPAEDKLGVSDLITTCPGNEVSTPVGHFNMFPLPSGSAPWDHKVTDGHVIMAYREGLPGTVINQVNHPRWGGLDYFGHLDLLQITSESTNPNFSFNFEAMEIMNETIGWGLLTGPGNKLSVWDDWFNFLNKGFRVTGTGNSDSHVLLSMPAGWPRNYIASSTENPGELDPYALTENIIQHRVSVARGVFVNMVVNYKWPIGTDVVDTDGSVDIRIEMLAPSWCNVDKVTLYGNAREIWSEEINIKAEVLNYQKKITLSPKVDTWYVVKAEGSESLWPIIPDQKGIPVTPVGFTNPIWVDIDGAGFETESDRATQFIEKYQDHPDDFKAAVKEADWWLQRQILAQLEKDSDLEWIMIYNFLSLDVEMARKYAYTRFDDKADEDNIPLLKSVSNNLSEEKEQALLTTYIAKLGPKTELMDFMFNRIIDSEPVLRSEQCKILSMEQYPKDWQLVAPFVAEGDSGLNVPFAPETNVDFSESYTGKDGMKLIWQPLTAEADGFVDFTKITDEVNNSLGYAYSSIRSAADFKTVLFFGSDDGAVIWHNGVEMYRKLVRRGAHEYEECLPITLVKGDNTFLVKVDNRRGTWDFHFQLFDPVGKLSQ